MRPGRTIRKEISQNAVAYDYDVAKVCSLDRHPIADFKWLQLVKNGLHQPVSDKTHHCLRIGRKLYS